MNAAEKDRSSEFPPDGDWPLSVAWGHSRRVSPEEIATTERLIAAAMEYGEACDTQDVRKLKSTLEALKEAAREIRWLHHGKPKKAETPPKSGGYFSKHFGLFMSVRVENLLLENRIRTLDSLLALDARGTARHWLHSGDKACAQIEALQAQVRAMRGSR